MAKPNLNATGKVVDAEGFFLLFERHQMSHNLKDRGGGCFSDDAVFIKGSK